MSVSTFTIMIPNNMITRNATSYFDTSAMERVLHSAVTTIIEIEILRHSAVTRRDIDGQILFLFLGKIDLHGSGGSDLESLESISSSS